jgi:hypothetical protein
LPQRDRGWVPIRDAYIDHLRRLLKWLRDLGLREVPGGRIIEEIGVWLRGNVPLPNGPPIPPHDELLRSWLTCPQVGVHGLMLSVSAFR